MLNNFTGCSLLGQQECKPANMKAPFSDDELLRDRNTFAPDPTYVDGWRGKGKNNQFRIADINCVARAGPQHHSTFSPGLDVLASQIAWYMTAAASFARRERSWNFTGFASEQLHEVGIILGPCSEGRRERDALLWCNPDEIHHDITH